MMNRSGRWLALLAVTGLTLSVLAACGEEEEGAPTPGETAAATPQAPPGAEVQGVTDTEIKFGSHLPLSQHPAAVYAPIGDGLRAYFNYINDTEGGVHGRQITFIVFYD